MNSYRLQGKVYFYRSYVEISEISFKLQRQQDNKI